MASASAHSLSPEAAALLPLIRDYELWARTCYRIRTQAGTLRRLRLRPAQRLIGQAEADELKLRGKARIYILKARRAGFTTDQQAKGLKQIWSEGGFDALTLAHTLKSTGELFEITRRAVQNFPAGLLPRQGDKETTEVSFPDLDSHFYTATAGGKGPGRGATLKRVHGSEFAFWEDPLSTLAAVTPAMEGVPGNVLVLETTASAFDSPAHRFWKKSQTGANGYRALFFPWWECDRNYRLPLLAPDELGKLEPEEQALVDRFQLGHEQIKWRRERIAEMEHGLFLQEYAEDAETCWLTAGGLYYDASVLKAVQLASPAVLRSEDGVDIYHEPPAGERLILGADTAEGVDQDRSTFVLRSFPSWRLVATFASSRVEPAEFARIIATWGRKWGGPALLVIEKNAHGITVLRDLRDIHKYPVNRIYHRTPLDKTKDEKTERIGWATTAESVPLMLAAGSELLRAAKAGNAEAPGAPAMRDAFGIVRDKNGKVSMTGRDLWVAEVLAWIGRGYPLSQSFSYARAGQ